MADTAISALTALLGAGVADADLLPIVDTGVGTKKITVAEARIALVTAARIAAALGYTPASAANGPAGDDGDLQAKSGSGFASAGTPAEMLAAAGVSEGIAFQRFVEVDLGAIEVGPTGLAIIPSPGVSAFVVPLVAAIIGEDACVGMNFGWAADQGVLSSFDSDVAFNFAGGRYAYFDVEVAQPLTSVVPINNPFKLFITGGVPAATSIEAAGTGYVVGDTVADPFGGTFHATINTVGGSGEVLTYTVTDHGTRADYTQGENDLLMENVAPQSGTGTGFTLQCDSLRGGEGAILKVTYDIIGP